MSCEDLKSKGFEFDEKQRVVREPQAEIAAAAAEQ